MSSRIPYRLWIALILASFSAVAQAENPRISLKVENATCVEALAALSKGAGIAAELFPVAPAQVPLLDEKASFDWSDATFGRALRQICQRYRLHPSPRPGGYTLYPDPGGAPALPAKRVGLVEKDGVRLFVRAVSVSMNRRVSFVGDQPAFDNSSLALDFGGELATGDADTIAGIDNVSARDDTGHLMLSQVGRSSLTSPYPDEWQGGVSLTGFNPRAQKLEWIEGDLMVYKKYQPRRAEFALPLPAGGARQRVGAALVEVTGGDEGAAAPAPGGAPRIAGPGPKLRVRFAMPRPEDGSLDTPRIAPVLVGASGRTYWQFSGGTTTRADEIGVTQEINAEFSNVFEAVTGVVVQWVEKSQPVKRFSFRMVNVPLPGEGVFVPVRALPAPRPRPVTAPPERPFEEQGGGTLLNRVQIQDRPAPEGTLSLGLALKTGAAWSAIRWQDVETDRDGIARLTDLKPGTYRLMRIFRPKDALTLPDAGHWLNGEVQVAVTAAKETAPPPLRWEPESAVTKPAAPARPASATPTRNAPVDAKSRR